MGEKLKCAIVDDEPLAVELLVSYVLKVPFMELVGKYSNAIDALKGITDQQVDLVFLDIQMPELTGLELSKMLPESTRIVFTTAFQQYAVDGYRINALDYLMKPISYFNFLEACNKALQWFNLTRQHEGAPDKEQEAKSIVVARVCHQLDLFIATAQVALSFGILDLLLHVQGLFHVCDGGFGSQPQLGGDFFNTRWGHVVFFFIGDSVFLHVYSKLGG